MSIPFSCPHCQTRTLVDDRYAGASGRCVECGKPITVPGRTHAQGAAPPGADPRLKTKKRSVLPLVGVIVGAVLVSVMGISLLIMMVLPVIERARITAQGSRSAENLRQIGVALKMYESKYGRFPPPYLADPKTGKPMHSWRVLILPFLGQEGLYRRYDFSQPWDSPSNMNLMNMMPSVYANPSDGSARISGETPYLVVVGKNTVFPDDGSTAEKDITDDHTETILVVESDMSPVIWLEPLDLDAKKIDFSINGVGDGIGGCRPDGANVLTVDGNTRFLPNDTPSVIIEAMTTPRGGELITLDDIE